MRSMRYVLYVVQQARIHAHTSMHTDTMIMGFTKKNLTCLRKKRKQNRQQQHPACVYDGTKTAFPAFKSGMCTNAKNLLQCHILQGGRERREGRNKTEFESLCSPEALHDAALHVHLSMHVGMHEMFL